MISDSLRVVLDSVFAGPAYDWQTRSHPFGFLGRWWNALVGWVTRLGADHPQVLRAFLWLLVLVLLALALHAAWLILRGFRTEAPGAVAAPAGPARDAAWYRAEADRLVRSGRLVEAMQADFHALVLELDARRLVRFHPSKTPAEYVREAELSDAARGEFRSMVWTLYRHAFAREPLTPDAAAEWRARTASDRYAPAH
jgi:hypothetical protein